MKDYYDGWFGENYYFDLYVQVDPKKWLLCLTEYHQNKANKQVRIEGKENLEKIVNILSDVISDNKLNFEHPKDYFENYDEYVLSELYNKKGE
jgi:hypothetical protein